MKPSLRLCIAVFKVTFLGGIFGFFSSCSFIFKHIYPEKLVKIGQKMTSEVLFWGLIRVEQQKFSSL